MFSNGLIRFVASTALALLAVGFQMAPVRAQNGHTLSAVGPVNQSMGGAGVAHPLDAIGAIHWNPATITAFSGTSLSVGIDFFAPSAELRSSTAARSVGGVFPPVDLSGTTEAKKKVFLIPSGAIVHHNPDSRLAYGVGVFAIAGFGVEYPEDPRNPVLSPQPFGFGHLKSQYSAVQIVPTVAYKLTKHISVGIAPTLTRQSLSIEPFLIGPRGDYSGTGVPIYKPGEHEASSFGIGVQTGVYYTASSGLELGLSYKSPLAFKRLKFETSSPTGQTATLYFPLDYPSIISVGVGYKGPSRWGFAGDVRYVNYKGVNGFESLGVGPGREVRGLGWRGIWATAAGASYKFNARVGLRGGYSFAQRAMPDDVALFNVAAPTLVRHKLAGGVSIAMTESSTFNFTYTHNFAGSLVGPRFGPGTPSALGTVETTASGNGFLVGFTKAF